MVRWWKQGHHGGHCGAHVEGGPAAFAGRWPHGITEESQAAFGGGGFGVRRPLRFLAWKLGLNETQVTELAAILDELKTERAQAAVDDRRTLTAFAEAVSGATFDEAKAKSGASLRAKSAEHLQDAVVRALGRIHALLDPEQRTKLGYLIRTGSLMM
jgi:Spy/CpxP family protein refolding chaperone